VGAQAEQAAVQRCGWGNIQFENTATNYKTGDEFHFEWAIGREIATGFVLGIVGYDYRQITGDTGSGATLGPFKGRVDAVGQA